MVPHITHLLLIMIGFFLTQDGSRCDEGEMPRITTTIPAIVALVCIAACNLGTKTHSNTCLMGGAFPGLLKPSTTLCTTALTHAKIGALGFPSASDTTNAQLAKPNNAS